MQIAIKPAKPLAFAAIGGVPAFGLPGNPVSSRVSFELLARPALRKLAGRSDFLAEPVLARAASDFRRRPDGRVHFDRVTVRVEDGQYVCERAGVQASNVLSGMAAATGLARLEVGEGAKAGDLVPVLPARRHLTMGRCRGATLTCVAPQGRVRSSSASAQRPSSADESMLPWGAVSHTAPSRHCMVATLISQPPGCLVRPPGDLVV